MKGFKFALPYICMVVLFFYLMFSSNKRVSTIGVFVFIIGFASYYLISLYDSFIIWKKDMEDGDQEAILEYIGTYGRMPSNTAKGTFSPGLISANFRVHNMLGEDNYNLVGKIVSLSGDIKNYDFVEGNKYKVTMRIHSKKLINVEPFMNDAI